MNLLAHVSLDKGVSGPRNKRFFTNLITRCGAAWLIAGLLPAWLAFRFLYGDGAVYLLQIANEGHFFLPTGVRQSAQVLDQWPAVLAVQLGITNLRLVGWALGIGMLLTPILLHSISLAILLRRGWTIPAYVYLVMLWLLTFFSSLMAASESHVATAAFLLTVIVALKRSDYSFTNWLTMMTFSLISVRLYEFWFFYAASLIVVLIIRLAPRLSRLSKTEQAAGITTLLLLLGSSISHATTLLGSSDNPSCISVLQMLIGTSYPLYLTIIASWFIGLCAHLWLLSQRPDSFFVRIFPAEQTRMLALIFSFTALAALVLSNLQHNTIIRYSYPFRTLNLILPMIFLAWMIACTTREIPLTGFDGARTLIVLLTTFLLVQELRLTTGWRRYQEWVGTVSVPNDTTTHVALPPTTVLASTWTYPWTQSAQSFLAQALRPGPVRGVSFDPHTGWDPYGPKHPQALHSIANTYRIQWELGQPPPKGLN